MAYNDDASSIPSQSDLPTIIGSMLGGTVNPNPDGSYTVTSGTHQGYVVGPTQAAQILQTHTPAPAATGTGFGDIFKYIGIPLAAAFGGEALAGAFGGGAGAAGATAGATGGSSGSLLADAGGAFVPGGAASTGAATAGATAAGTAGTAGAGAAAVANPFAKLLVPGLLSAGANLGASLVQRSAALTASQQEIAAGQQALSLESGLYDKSTAALSPYVSGGQQSYANLQQFMAGGRR